MKPPLEERKAHLATVPWVRRLKRKVPCNGWMEGRKKCKNPAEWSYRRLRGGPVWFLVRRDEPTWAHFCWSHLWSRGFYGGMEEEQRWLRWLEKNPPPWRKPD